MVQHTCVHLECSFGHSSDRKGFRPRGSVVPKASSQARILYEQGSRVRKRFDVTWRNEESGLVVDDQFREAANAKRHRGDAKRHCVNYRGAESFRRRRVPEDIETSHCRMHFVDKAGANGVNAAKSRLPG